MDEVGEAPSKKRKIEDSAAAQEGNDTVAENRENSKSTKTKPVLQIKSASLARLRQAAKNCQILNLSPLKKQQNKDNEVTMTTGELYDKNQNDEAKRDEAESEKKDGGFAKEEGSDVIMSSTGSSPAHSPRPEDLTVLSTPQKQRKTLQNQFVGKLDVSKNLNNQFESPGEQEDKVADIGKDNSCQIDSESKKDDGNDVEKVEVDKKEEVKTEIGKEAGAADTSVDKQNIDFSPVEIKKVLRQMIDEKFKQVEELYQTQGPESELYERIAKLEDENRGLQEYAAKLEKAVKLLLNNQRNKKDRLSQFVQTDETVLPRAKSASSKTSSSPTTQAQSQLNHVNKPGNSAVVTSRLTSTQAPIPGHSVRPDSHPQQRVSYQQQQQVRVPSTSGPSHQGQAISGAHYQIQRPTHPQYVQNVRPSVPQGSVAVPRRPTPVTVTVHPQTTSLTNNMILSPAYPTQVQKSSYATANVRPTQPVKVQQFAPSPGNRPAGATPVVIGHRGPTAQPVPGVVARPPPPQQVVSPQGGQQVMKQYQNPASLRSPPVSRPGVPASSMHAMQGPVASNALATSPRSIQGATSPLTNRQTTPQSMSAISPREQGVAQNTAQPGTNNFQPRDQPPRPIVSIAVVTNGIVLSWNMQNMQSSPRIVRYQLFALQDMGSNNPPSQWKKIGVVNALPLPMACTLTQFMPGNKYHFTVRAQDEHGRCGPLSEPCTITLT